MFISLGQLETYCTFKVHKTCCRRPCNLVVSGTISDMFPFLSLILLNFENLKPHAVPSLTFKAYENVFAEHPKDRCPPMSLDEESR